jgi:hypothetical protein
MDKGFHTLEGHDRPYTQPYTIVEFLLFLGNLLDRRISNLLISQNERRFESPPLSAPSN